MSAARLAPAARGTIARAIAEAGGREVAFVADVAPDGTVTAAEVVARTRELGRMLREEAPTYLQPSAQELLLETTGDCLAVIERAVNWEAEKLYGVPGLGPFDEF